MRHVLPLAAALAVALSAPALAADPSIAPITTSPVYVAGEHAGDGLSSVRDAGDVNGDGRDDMVVSYSVFLGASLPMSARAYVVFGSGTDDPVDLADLGSRGFAIDGPPEAPWSFDVERGGDVNGDGRDDLIVSAPFAAKGSDDQAGRVFVVFGKTGTGTVDLNALGSGGYELYGPAHSFADAHPVSDLNGDGKDELLVTLKSPDRALLVFGKATTTDVALDALPASDGYALTAPSPPGIDAASGAGDVNGDGLEDLALSGGCGGGSCPSGRTWISFGKSDTNPVDLSALGSGGFVVTGNGLASLEPAGDVNGDGKDDVAISDPNSSRAFVVFGRSATSSLSLDALGAGGFRVDHMDGYLKAVGDVDGDGHDDLAVTGGASATPAIIYGKADTTTIDAADLLDRGFLLGGGAVSGAAGTTAFASGPRLAAAVDDDPLGRAGAGSVRLFEQPPPSFSLPSHLAYVAGGTIAAVPPTGVRRSSPLTYSVSPALPDGLALDPASGTISGTPGHQTDAAAYAVTAADRAGRTTRSVTIRIDDPAFATLTPAAGATTASRPSFAWEPASASDDTEPVASYTLVVDGQAIGTLAAWACAQRCELPSPAALPDGAHVWKVETTARDGHVRSTPEARLTVYDPPSAQLAPANTSAVTGEPIAWDASESSDANGGIVRYEFDLDGDGIYELDRGKDPRATATYQSIGDRVVGVRVTDAGGNVATASALVHVAPAPPPGELGISIDDGAIATNDPNVELSIVWPLFADTALVSNDGGFGAAGGTRQLPLAARIPWRLASSGPERLPKIVYLRFRGGEAGRETYTDDIILDERAPAVMSATLGALAATGSGATAARRRPAPAILRVVGRDDNSGLRRIEVAKAKGGKPVAAKQLVRKGRVGRRRVTATMQLLPRLHARYVRVVDVAGNASRWVLIRAARPRARHR